MKEKTCGQDCPFYIKSEKGEFVDRGRTCDGVCHLSPGSVTMPVHSGTACPFDKIDEELDERERSGELNGKPIASTEAMVKFMHLREMCGRMRKSCPMLEVSEQQPKQGRDTTSVFLTLPAETYVENNMFRMALAELAVTADAVTFRRTASGIELEFSVINFWRK